jgi:NRPS condensation-like uncharacterized protein
MIQQELNKESLSIELSETEHEKIKTYAANHGNTINEYILESIRERMRHEDEEFEMLKLTSTINPVLKEVWDNERDAVYDEL